MKRSLLRLFASVLSVLALTFAAVGPAFAGPGTDTIKAKQTTLFDLLRQGTPDAQKKIDAIFDDMMDYDAFAQGSLGTEWAARTDAEKAEFSDLLKQLVRKAYQKNLKKILGYEVTYTGEDAADGGAVLVKTQSKAKDNARDEPVEIDFKMVQKGSAWKVQDIVTEGQSTVGSYRNQFTKIIKRDGFRALIDKMKKKLADGDFFAIERNLMREALEQTGAATPIVPSRAAAAEPVAPDADMEKTAVRGPRIMPLRAPPSPPPAAEEGELDVEWSTPGPITGLPANRVERVAAPTAPAAPPEPARPDGHTFRVVVLASAALFSALFVTVLLGFGSAMVASTRILAAHLGHRSAWKP